MTRQPPAPVQKGRGERRLRAATIAEITAVGITAVGITAAALADAADPPAPQGVRYVTLIRHGHYDRVDSLDDRTANGLSRQGREQAHLLGERLAALPVTPALFVSSDLLRAIETADEIDAVIGRTATRDTLIAECTSPSSRPGLDEQSTPVELAACQASMEAAWEKYFVPSPVVDQHDVLVCHGNVIRWFVNRALGNDTRHWTSLDIGHASLTVISVRPDGGTRLILYSDVGHLPVGLQSWAGRGAGWGVPKK